MTAATSSPAPLRLFFALVPDAPLRATLAGLAHQLVDRAGGRPVAAANIHLTLAFLGETAAAALAPLQAIGEAVPRASFSLVLDHVGGFRGAGVAWLGAREVPDALSTMHRLLVAALSANGFPLEARSFRVHVTLARKCRRLVREPLSPPLVWRPTELALVQSTLAPGGSVYHPLASWPLSAGDVQGATGTV